MAIKKNRSFVNGKTMVLKIADILTLPDYQMREGINEDHVVDLERTVKSRVKLPKVKVRKVEGVGFILTDGFHTLEAHKKAGKISIDASVISGGGIIDAKLDAAGANKQHNALKMTQAEKRRAVQTCLQALADGGLDWPNSKVALHCGVGDDLVAELRGKVRMPTEPVERVSLRPRSQNSMKSVERLKHKDEPEPEWRSKPIDEVVDPSIFTEIPTDRIPNTVGELHDRLSANEKFKLPVSEYKKVVEAAEEVSGEKLPELGRRDHSEKIASAVVSWPDVEATFGRLSRYVDLISKQANAPKDTRSIYAAFRLLDEFGKLMKGWKEEMNG